MLSLQLSCKTSDLMNKENLVQTIEMAVADPSSTNQFRNKLKHHLRLI